MNASCKLYPVPESRTDKIEEIVARFCAAPLTAETVFLRPAYLRGALQREVCDVLMALRRQGIVLSLKSQEVPTSRTGPTLQRWCAKSAAEAANQISGACRSLARYATWCDHWRRGRVDFAAGAVTPVHGLAVIEIAVDATGLHTVPLPTDLPDNAGSVPIAYVALNDVLSLVNELRSLPDLIAYLDARSRLARVFQRRLGDEQLLMHYYLMHNETFDGCDGPDSFLTSLLVTEKDFRRRLALKVDADRSAKAIEYVSNELAMPDPGYATGLDADTLGKFQPGGYLTLQENLCDLRLGDRRALGTALLNVCSNVERLSERGLARQVWLSDTKPDFLYLLVSTRGVARPDLLRSMPMILRAAMAAHRKTRGMAIVDRDGVNFEVALSELPELESDPAVIEVGRKLFGGRKMTTIETSMLPKLVDG
jgi:hypothetical protein